MGRCLHLPSVGAHLYCRYILMGFFLYKGLKKPLIFFGLKDKYIYFAMGSAVGGIVLIALLSSLFGIVGLVVGAAVGGSAVFLTYKTQDRKGLYNKTKNEEELHMIPSKFRNVKFLQKKTDES